MTYTGNILSVFETATESQTHDGFAWYPEAHNLARRIGGGNVAKGAGLIAAFSPMTPWDRNVTLACMAGATGIATGHTVNMCRVAQSILDGSEPLSVLNGQKTNAFARTIIDPAIPDLAVIDRHAFEVCLGYVLPDNKRNIGKRIYREMSAAYVEAAHLVGILPSEIQAITWIVWRHRKGIA